jgi:hypothetical protein
VPSLVKLLLHPELRRPGPPPVRVDLKRVLLVGIAAWTGALVVALVALAVGSGDVAVVATCGAGIGLGGAGLLWEKRNRSTYRGE